MLNFRSKLHRHSSSKPDRPTARYVADRRTSSYQATVRAYPVWRVARRTFAQSAAAQGAARRSASARRKVTYHTEAQPQVRKKARLTIGKRLSEWIVQARRPKNRRSRARLGASRRPNSPQHELSDLGKAVLAPARSAWRVNGNAILNVLFLALIGWALFWFFTDDRFYVRQVSVTGNQRVSSETIIAASGLSGYSIFWINSYQVAARIREALQPVRQVQVKYNLPNEVVLSVEEQGGQVMWQIAGQRYWADDDGKLHLAQDGVAPGILIQDMRANVPERIEPQAVVAAQQLMTWSEIKDLYYDPKKGLYFTHAKGWEVYLGVGGDMSRKMNILKSIEAQFAAQDAVQPIVVDLRFPDSPYYRLPNEGGV